MQTENVAIGYPTMQGNPLYLPQGLYPSYPPPIYTPQYYAPQPYAPQPFVPIQQSYAPIQQPYQSFSGQEKTEKGLLGKCKTALCDVVSKKRTRYDGTTHRVLRDRFVGVTAPVWFPIWFTGQVCRHVPLIIIVS